MSRTDVNSRTNSIKNSLFEILSKRVAMISITFLPVLILITLVFALPIIWAIAAAFHGISAFSPDWTWEGLGNFRMLFADSDFHLSLYYSIIFAGGSIIIQVIGGVGLALLINREFKFQYVTRSLVMLPYLVPTVVIGFMALWMGNSNYGIVNQLLSQLGLIDTYVPWFGHYEYSMPAVILTGSWKFTIFVTIMVLARLQGIPDGFYEAARMSGANVYQRFRDITLPNIKNIIFIVILLRGVWMFNKFDIIYVLTRGGPQDATTTAPVYAYEVAFSETELGIAAAISVLLFLLLFIVAIIYFHYFRPSEEVSTA